MHKHTLVAAAMALGLASTSQAQVVISQAFGNGATSGQPNADYVELFNRGAASVNLAGWSLQISRNIGQASNPVDWAIVTIPSGTINPGQYFLVQIMAAGAGNPLPTPDAIGSVVSTALFSTEGGVALVNSSTPLTNDICPVGNASVVDFVKWGGGTSPAPSCFEGTARATQSESAYAIFRRDHGCTDDNNNVTDFIEASPQPRNTSFEYPYGLTTNLATLVALPNTTVVITVRGRSNVCGSGNVPLTSATVDLSPIPGGPSALALHDDGLNGDATGSDGVWSAEFTVPPGTPLAKYPATFSLNSASGNIAQSVDFIVPVDGDMCGNARVLTQASLPVTDGPITTTTLTDDPIISPCRSGIIPLGARMGIWYTITPTSDFVLKALKTGTGVSTFNQSLWTGTCGNLTAVDCDDSNSLANWRLSAGVTYYLLSMYDNDSLTVTPGNPTYTFSVTTPPVNDLCSGAIDLNALPNPYIDTTSGIFQNATADAAIDCDDSPLGARRGVWYKYTAAQDTNLYTSETISGVIVRTSLWSGSCAGGLTFVSCTSGEVANYFIPAGQTRYLLVSLGSSAQPEVTNVNYSNLFFVAVNDTCAAAQIITALPIVDLPLPTLPIQHDTRLSCEVAGGAQLYHGLWWSYTPATDETITIWDTSTTKAIAAAVFKDNCPPTGVEEQCGTNDVTFNLDAGHAYYIVVGSNLTAADSSNTAQFRLNFVRSQRLTHDTCATAYPITQIPFSTIADISQATGDGPPAVQTGCNTGTPTVMSQSVWYKIKTLTAGTLTGSIEVDYARANTGVYAIYRSNDGTCNTLDAAPLACGLDGTGPMTINSPLAAATTYFLLIGLQATGTSTDAVISIDGIDYVGGTLDTGAQQCCRGTTCVSVTSGTCTGTIGNSASLVVGTCGPSNQIAHCCYADYDHSGTSTIDDLFIYINTWLVASPYTKIDGNTTAAPSIDDLFIFINLWLLGCQP